VCSPLLARAESAGAPAIFPVALEYTTDPACPDLDAFKAIVIGRLGYDPFRDDAPNRAFVRLASRGRGIEARVEWRDAAGKWTGDRSFPSRTDDCQELARAVGFALAVQIQLLAIVNAPPSPPLEDTPAATPAPPPIPAPAAVEPSRDPGIAVAAQPPNAGGRPAFGLGAGASVGVGLSSGPVTLGRVLGTVAWPHAQLELAVELGLPATTRRADGAGFSQQELLVSAAACGILPPVIGCALAKAGQIRIAGEIDVPLSHSGPLLQTGVRLGVMQPLGRRAYVSPHLDGLVNVTRWTVTLDQAPVWTAPRLAATLGIDLGMHFR
jgi:hypothetical protein